MFLLNCFFFNFVYYYPPPCVYMCVCNVYECDCAHAMTCMWKGGELARIGSLPTLWVLWVELRLYILSTFTLEALLPALNLFAWQVTEGNNCPLFPASYLFLFIHWLLLLSPCRNIHLFQIVKCILTCTQNIKIHIIKIRHVLMDIYIM